MLRTKVSSQIKVNWAIWKRKWYILMMLIEILYKVSLMHVLNMSLISQDKFQLHRLQSERWRSKSMARQTAVTAKWTATWGEFTPRAHWIKHKELSLTDLAIVIRNKCTAFQKVQGHTRLRKSKLTNQIFTPFIFLGTVNLITT
jgi:hypothetical protein